MLCHARLVSYSTITCLLIALPPQAWEAIQRRHGGVAAGGLGAPGVAGRDYGSPPKELAKKLAK